MRDDGSARGRRVVGGPSPIIHLVVNLCLCFLYEYTTDIY
jgi:hypothetical protein